jgi:mobilome CxxCx(11)CxxC protein
MKYSKENIVKDCYDFALHTYATHYVYSIRFKSKSRLNKSIILLGFIVPVLIGGIVSSYGINSQITVNALEVLTPIAILQLGLSSFSLIFKWEEQTNYYLESSIGNRLLSEEFLSLAKYPNEDIIQYGHSFEILLERNRNREEQDDKYPFNHKETRIGMRYSLRRFQRECVGCNIVPLSMESTSCNICGNFK